MKALYSACNSPVQICFRHANSHRELSFSINPVVTVLMIALIAIISTVMLITSVASTKQTLLSQQQQIAFLQHQQSQLMKERSELEASLSLSNGQIEAIKQELNLLNHDKNSMQQRLNMFDQVLAARKVKGVHLLRSSAQWRDSHTIAYDLILVKGQNYPRWAQGILKFYAVNGEGEMIQLKTDSGKQHLKYETTTQLFLEGTLLWPEAWQAEKLFIVVYNHNRKQINQTETPILKQSIISFPAETGEEIP